MKKEKEIWVDSYHFPEKYEVSNLGRIRLKLTGEIKKPSIRSGYHMAKFRHKNQFANMTLQRLIYFSFYPSTPLSLVIHHLDDNKLNNRLDNLAPIDRRAHSSMHSRMRILSGTFTLPPVRKPGLQHQCCKGFTLAICPKSSEIKYIMAGTKEIKSLGFDPSSVGAVIRGSKCYKTHKKYIFKRVPKDSTFKVGDIFDTNNTCLK